MPSARATRSGTRRRCRRAESSRRRSGSSDGISTIVSDLPRHAPIMSRARGGWPTACRAPARRPSASPALRGRPCPTGSRCAPASRRFRSAPARGSGPRAITKPPTCCDRWRGKPSSVSTSDNQARDLRTRRIEAGFASAAWAAPAGCPTMRAIWRDGRLGRDRGPALCRHRAARCAAR